MSDVKLYTRRDLVRMATIGIAGTAIAPALEGAAGATSPRSRSLVTARNLTMGRLAKGDTIHGVSRVNLLAAWDGIDNVGLGDDKRNTSSPIFADLSGNGYDLELNELGGRVTWGDNCLTTNFSRGSQASCGASLAEDKTVEIVPLVKYAEFLFARVSSRSPYVYTTNTTYRRLRHNNNSIFVGSGPFGCTSDSIVADNNKVPEPLIKICIYWDKPIGTSNPLTNIMYRRGRLLESKTLWDTERTSSTRLAIMGVYGGSYTIMYGNFYAGRLYSEMPTDEIRRANDDADVARFGLVLDS